MPHWNPQSVDAHKVSLRLGLGLGVAIALLLLILLIKLLLPWLLLLAGLGSLGYWWRRRQQQQQQLYQCFYACLEQYHGKISVLDFAIAAHITGPQARTFLEARAKDFFADFEPTNYGDILYTFRQSSTAPNPSVYSIELPSNARR